MASKVHQPVPLDRVAQRGRRALGVVSLALLLAGSLATSAHAASVGLGSADAFSVLGASTVTNTGPSTLTGDLGVSPGTAITGFPPGTVNGSTHPNDGVAQRAQADLTTAYDDARGRSSTATVSADLAGRTLSPGVYTSATSLVLSGDLTLDAQGDPSAVFVFQAGSTLTTASGSHVLLIGGAQACNVFWVVDTATLGAATAFKGNILALTSISLTTGATLDGRALARNGAVSLDTNTVTRASCAAAPAPTPTPGPAATPTPTPTPGPAATPTPTPTPGPAATPTPSPGAIPGPGATPTPGGAPGPGATPTPGGDAGPGATPTPGGGPGPEATPGEPVGNTVPSAGSATIVTTGPASHVGHGQAHLTGRVGPGAAASRYFFQFGKTKHYGHHTASGRAGAKAARVHAGLRGLRGGRTYHYRLVSVGPGGRRTYGSDRTFRTARARPSRSPARPQVAGGGFTG